MNMSITYLQRFLANNYFFIIPAISIVGALMVFAYIGFEHTPEGRILFYQRLSQEFSPGTINQKRFSSIANAISHGKKHYTFSASHLPILSSK